MSTHKEQNIALYNKKKLIHLKINWYQWNEHLISRASHFTVSNIVHCATGIKNQTVVWKAAKIFTLQWYKTEKVSKWPIPLKYIYFQEYNGLRSTNAPIVNTLKTVFERMYSKLWPWSLKRWGNDNNMPHWVCLYWSWPNWICRKENGNSQKNGRQAHCHV